MNDINELFKLAEFRERIYKSNEYLKLKNFRLFRNSYGVFKGNFMELIKILNKHEKVDIYELVHSKNGQKKLDKFHLEITRCLHNFLASAFSLIDNTRKQTKSSGDIFFQNELNEKITELFSNNTTHIFIKDLRNFTQHFKMPQVSSKTSFTRADDKGLNNETKLYITTTHLIGFEWSAKSKEIIKNNTKGVYIKSILHEYYNLVTNFQKWYEQKQKGLLKTELLYISKQEKELKKQQFIFNLNIFFSNGSKSKDEFEKILFRHISTFYYKKIINCSKENRVDLVLKSLKNLGIRTTDYEKKIKDVNNYWL